MNAYLLLGLEPRLVLSEESLAEAFREAGKTLHPDAGGAEDEFSALHEAHALLVRPSLRLRHFMELRGMPLENRGAIDDGLMELFGTVGAVNQRAEAVARKREEARSALVRSLFESEAQECRDAVEEELVKVEREIASECASFPEYESAPRESATIESAAKTARNLAFLEKWRAGLRASYARLV